MLPDYDNLLVAVDGSPQAETAFKEALRIARLNHATLTCIYVVDDSAYHTNADDPLLERLLTNEERHAEEVMIARQELAKQNGVALKTEVLYGNPKHTIVGYPDQVDGAIDLIILGATGKDATQLSKVGSTTSFVVDQAGCNVVVVRN